MLGFAICALNLMRIETARKRQPGSFLRAAGLGVRAPELPEVVPRRDGPRPRRLPVQLRLIPAHEPGDVRHGLRLTFREETRCELVTSFWRKGLCNQQENGRVSLGRPLSFNFRMILDMISKIA